MYMYVYMHMYAAHMPVSPHDCDCVAQFMYTAGIQTSSTNTQYSEQFVVMFTLVMTQLKQVELHVHVSKRKHIVYTCTCMYIYMYILFCCGRCYHW